MDDLIKKSDIEKNNERLLLISRESIDRFYPDAKQMFEDDWKETTDDGIAFEIDEASYRELEKQGRLVIFSARYGGKLAGYINFIASSSMHHKKVITSCAGFYVSPEYRGKTGNSLYEYAVTALRDYGIYKMRISSSLKNDIGKFLLRKGMKAEETIYGLILD